MDTLINGLLALIVSGGIPGLYGILLLGFGGIVVFLWKKFSKIDKKVVENANTMTEISDSLTTIASLLSSQKTILESIRDKNVELTDDKAKILFELQMEKTFRSFTRIYYDTMSYVKEKTDESDITSQENLCVVVKEKLVDEYNAVYLELKDNLGNFNHEGKPLVRFIDTEWESDYLHLTNTVYNRIVTGTNGVKEYLKNKRLTAITEFNIKLQK